MRRSSIRRWRIQTLIFAKAGLSVLLAGCASVLLAGGASVLLAGGASVLLVGCASTQTAKQFRYIGYENTPTPQKSVGTVEGKDCSWSVLGYSLGPPNVRAAFLNASAQKTEGFVPGQTGEVKGPPLKSARNVTVEHGGFSAWVVARSCITVTAEGYL